ncbi:MAG: alpha/beta hydrolase [Caldicoprobacterales bacterium]|jgi:alpha-beta hydrolase superfamily lysophospholipase|nr:alpha/beta hydrolase [Clostridiales bacterium]
MGHQRFILPTKDNTPINVNKWDIDEGISPRGIVQISHGMAEWAYRYDSFARELNKVGFIVFANDHRGHGLTAPQKEEIGYIAADDGFSRMVEDMAELNEFIRKEYPDLPIVLFGHSMGSFLSQRFIQLYGTKIQGLILSGSNGKQSPIINFGILLAYIEMKTKGRRHRSQFLNKLTFEGYNRAFAPNRTGFDWLSRDDRQVDLYIEDPYCGGVFTASFFYDFLSGLKLITKKRSLKTIPKDLPVFIFSGSMDPVGLFGKGVENLVNMYKSIGMTNISYKIYPGGRHEMLNELNRDEVIEDIITWLNTSIANI